ncbi:MAG: NAD(P)/FAD-dependent oxidoreductase [Saprospiraceae bacterium]|nr:NAD(P)/FAD-dependent oxidoreductase [Saprospiraceae bacterium]
MTHHEVLVIGGGTAGLSVAAALRNRSDAPQVTIIDPSEKHYYQPIWTLVGAGVFPKEVSERNEADYIPDGANWIKEKVATFQPENNSITLTNGDQHTYDILVVAAGIQIDWDKIPGLKDNVGKPGTGICSNYSYETVDSTWENIRNLKKGTAIFTHVSGPVKCGGAPMKITFLASDYWRKHGLANQVKVKFIKAGGGIFDVPKYVQSLKNVAEKYNLDQTFNSDLIALNADAKEATFKNLKSGEEWIEKYDMIHVTPPQSSPDFIKQSPIANDAGWVEVDKYTAQHIKYPNIFSLGDCSSLPTSKTGAAIRKQVPVVVENLMSYQKGNPIKKTYDGYTSCPVVTGYGSLILAEFDYDKNPAESFPFDQSKERYSMYALKAYGLPRLYWHGMLRGREF